MYQISTAVKNAFFDGAEQDLRITFLSDNRVVSANDGRIEAHGAKFVSQMSSDDELNIGETLASTFSVRLINNDGAFNGYGFGEALVEIGVKVSGSWTYIPMGYYFLEKPVKTKTQVIEVTDATDRMRLFEADATAYIAGLTYPLTMNTLLANVCTYLGVTMRAQSFTDYTMTVNPFPASCTFRDILSWIAEKRKTCARFNRSGHLEFFWLGATAADTILRENIGQGSEDLAEYETTQVTSTVIKNLAGLAYTNGSDATNTFFVNGNPFMQEQDLTLLTFAQTLPLYVPFSCEALKAHPALDCGDLLTVQLTERVWSIYTTVVSGTTYAVNDGGANVYGVYEEEPMNMTIPLMYHEITWDGKTHAAYMATGSRVRPEAADAQYAINVANSGDGVIEKIRVKGLSADWINAGTMSAARVVITGGDTVEEAIDTVDEKAEAASSAASTADGKATAAQSTANAAKSKTDGLATGTTVINGGCITTGIIQSADADHKYSVNLDTGTVNMASANITGGSININTDIATRDSIKLNHSEGVASMSPARFVAKNNNNGCTTQYEGGGMFTYDTAAGVSTGKRASLTFVSGSGGNLNLCDPLGVLRLVASPYGLSMYDGDSNLTGKVYATDNAQVVEASDGQFWTVHRKGNFVICSTYQLVTLGTGWTAWGALYASGVDSIPSLAYPVTFDSNPHCVVQAEKYQASTPDAWLSTARAGTATETPGYELIRATLPSQSNTYRINYIVSGNLT